MNFGRIIASLQRSVDAWLPTGLKSPQDMSDLDYLKSAQITVFIGLMLMFISMFISITRLVMSQEVHFTNIVPMMLSLGTIYFLFRIKKTGKVNAGKYFILSVIFVDFPLRMYDEGGLLSPSVPWTFFIPSMAYLLMSKRAAILSSGFLIAILIGFFIAHRYMVFPQPRGPIYILFNYIAVIVVMAVLLRIVHIEYQKYATFLAIEDEKNELLKQSNLRLKQISEPLAILEQDFANAISSKNWVNLYKIIDDIEDIHRVVAKKRK